MPPSPDPDTRPSHEATVLHPPADRQILIVSNRLPVRVDVDAAGDPIVERTAGGLASALQGLLDRPNVRWIGWPGSTPAAENREAIRTRMRELDLEPVFLRPDQERHYYARICNEVFWPLFHYFTDRVRFDPESWQHYVEVNQLFAESILEVCEDDAVVWIHDFHLMLVPQLLRDRRPNLHIGFFLHIPFPSSEIYRLLPSREQVMEGLLGADYIGFHTHDYARHFRASLLRVFGLDAERDHVRHAGRTIGIGINPIGIDVAGFDESLEDPETGRIIGELEQRYAGRKLLLGVERLDYTKGVKLKLQAFAELLQSRPDLAHSVTLLQVLVPSRLGSSEYREIKSEIEEFIANVNGRFGQPGWTPIEYIHRNLDRKRLTALYRFADVGLVTPIRDGMNLVAQEYVLCKDMREKGPPRRAGALVLSEFAGAAQHLPHAFLANPWSVEDTAAQIESALETPAEELDRRMMPMIKQVRRMDSRIWGEKFLERLNRSAAVSRKHECTPLVDDEITQLATRFRDAPRRVMLLDYDGTLREFVRTPEAARPTPEILDLLKRLADDARTEVHMVSGRHRNDLETWFGHLPIHLSAEHGFASRAPGREWVFRRDVDLTWMARVREILDGVAEEVPGTLVERKPCGLAWHYRMADVDYGVWRARELHTRLEDELGGMSVDILHGHRVIEVRAAGINKGSYVSAAVQGVTRDSFMLCVGDDRTDQDMYRVLPNWAVTAHVGPGADATTYRIESPSKVRGVLRQLIERPRHRGRRIRGWPAAPDSRLRPFPGDGQRRYRQLPDRRQGDLVRAGHIRRHDGRRGNARLLRCERAAGRIRHRVVGSRARRVDRRQQDTAGRSGPGVCQLLRDFSRTRSRSGDAGSGKSLPLRAWVRAGYRRYPSTRRGDRCNRPEVFAGAVVSTLRGRRHRGHWVPHNIGRLVAASRKPFAMIISSKSRALQFVACFWLAAVAGSSSAHTLFLKPEAYRVGEGGQLTFHVINGTFVQSESNIVSKRRGESWLIKPDGSRESIERSQWNRTEIANSIDLDLPSEGGYLAAISIKTGQKRLDPDSFNFYLEYEGLIEQLEARKNDGQLQTGVVENFAKYAKSLVTVGDVEHQLFDTAVGQPVELVLQNDPSKLSPGDTLTVQLIKHGKPLADTIMFASTEEYVDVDDRGLIQELISVRSGEDGMASFEIPYSGVWYVRFIDLIRTDESEYWYSDILTGLGLEEPRVFYRSLWATHTFEIK